jgi:hypothetical protein
VQSGCENSGFSSRSNIRRHTPSLDHHGDFILVFTG